MKRSKNLEELIFISIMKDIDFAPVLGQLLPTVKDVFSFMYYGRHCGKNIVITQHQCKTVLIALRDSCDWSTEFHTIVSSRNENIKAGYKIDGTENTILLLDAEGNLWKLINAFEFSNEEDECLHLIDENCFYEWVPFKKLNGYKVLELTALKNNFAFLMESNQKKKVLQIHSSGTLTFLEDYTFEELNLTTSLNYCMTKCYFDFQNDSDNELQNINEVLVITDKDNESTYICTVERKVLLMNVSSKCLISVLEFPKEKCFLLCYKNGKFLFVHITSTFQILKEFSLNVLSKVICIERCYCSESCVIWSDGMNLHHTNIKFQLENPKNFVKLIHLQISRNVMNVKSLIKIHSGLLGVTINNFYYWIFLDKDKNALECFKSVDDIFSRIFNCSNIINSLNEEISHSTNYLKFKEMIQTKSYLGLFELKRENDYFVIKTNIKYIFKKDYWRIRQEACINNKHHVEISNLTTDLGEGMVVKFKSSLMFMNSVEFSFMGNFGNEYDLLIMYIGKIDVNKNSELSEVAKNLYELAKKRNPYFKHA